MSFSDFKIIKWTKLKVGTGIKGELDLKAEPKILNNIQISLIKSLTVTNKTKS